MTTIPNNVLDAIRTIEAADTGDLLAALQHEGGFGPRSLAAILEVHLPQRTTPEWRHLTWEERKFWLIVASSLGKDNLAAIRVISGFMSELEKF